MKHTFLTFIMVFYSISLLAQQRIDSSLVHSQDSLMTKHLNEVIVIGNPTSNALKEKKALGSIDSYLGEAQSVNMVKRGAYAWEPMLNGMSTERSILTIDGMRIFQACTDKMDPITSYVENTNLSSAKIQEGQSGAEFGSTIAGSINLIRRKSGFKSESGLGGSVFAGFENNNKQQIYGATLNYFSPKFFTDVDFTFRDAENYQSGRKADLDTEVLYSQFTKYNLSAITGVKLKEGHELEGSLIFDRATDVGYPGLPMDVSLAQALIASLQYRFKNMTEHIQLWETKAYYNTITHIMDDSPRPVVPIRMDMPGWSKTSGFYSKINGNHQQHSFYATLSGYLNNSLAEMTMYPDDPKEKDMFMLTWPDVNTLYGGLSVDDNIAIGHHLMVTVQAGLGVQQNVIKSDLGLNSLRLFYPDLERSKTRLLKNISSLISYHHRSMMYQAGIGFGDRAPSVSEGYGFYLLNINDNYDYVGNPYLKNEKSLNLELSTLYDSDRVTARAKVNYFYMMDYIVGKPRPGIPAMNMTAAGIKVYEQLPYASIFNSSLGIDYQPAENWTLAGDVSYRYGQGAQNTILPLIQPFNYQLKMKYNVNTFFAEIALQGSSKNRNSIEFGEIQKPAYTITNLSFSKAFNFNEQSFTIKAGVENLFDRYYSTFDDWFGIPRMGRNIYFNLVYQF